MSTNCKFYKEEEYVSYDSGITWTAMGVYRKGDLIEYDSEDCGYVPPTPTGNTKFSATYTGGRTYSAACDGDTELTSATTKPSGYQYTAMTTAWIGDCVTSIDGRAFYRCSGLTSIDIPNNVISIGGRVFYQCRGLTSCTIGSGVTSIGTYAFYQCTSLTSIVIPDSVTSIGTYAFYYCTSLTSVTIEATTPPTLGNDVFQDTNNCPIYVPCASVSAYKAATNWSTYADRIQGIPPCSEPLPTRTKFSASYNNGTSYSAVCDNSTILSSGDTHPSGYQASGITSAEIGSCITSIGCRSFYGASYFNEMCTSMTSITIPNSVTSLGVSSFERCISLPSVTIPDGVVYIDDYAFNNCSGLTNVTIGSGVTSIGSSVFYGCSGLTNITIPNNVAYIGGNCFYKSRLTRLNSNTNGVFNIPSNLDGYCFYECSGITTLTLENGVTSIGERAFSNCTNLTSVTIPNSVTSVGSKAFQNTPWYRSYSADTSNQYGNIVYINDIAYQAVNKNITNCTFKTNTVTIGGAAFVDCSRLTSVTIPNTVTSIEIYAFAGCRSLTTANIQSGVTSIGNYAFSNCTNLTSVTIPNSLTNIGELAFQNTPWYRSYSADTSNQYGNIVYINDIAYQAVNTSITSCTFKPTTKTIGDGAFRSCNGLTSVVIPNSITSIGNSAFGSCTSLTNATIPNSVTSIGYAAFNACTSLTSVTVESTTPPIIEDDVFNQANSLIIYVSSESVDAYKTARGWNRYASRIQAIP